ncbi:putative pterin-binding protein [Pseudodonghicola xiamenensis]|nr:oxidoreductase [Pseudodonghicola xiamenensis]
MPRSLLQPTLALLVRLTLVMALSLPLRAMAQDLAPPEGEVLLTVSGEITQTNVGATAQFDRRLLESMQPVTIATTTIWTDGVQQFTGIPLIRLMRAVGASGHRLKATAINDYAVDIPSSDWVENGPIVAYLRNGAPMSVRDKGPLWIVYPYDTNPAYQGEVIYARSIWQLDRIIVE